MVIDVIILQLVCSNIAIVHTQLLMHNYLMVIIDVSLLLSIYKLVIESRSPFDMVELAVIGIWYYSNCLFTFKFYAL